ncbi:4Fe-4S binding protein, partial [Enterobacter hormaechei]|nr:4Fe-4S binding protein [Enterobacter hormaechei]
NVPEWDSAKCIQCNQCALVCPHAAIRPILVNEDEKAKAPASVKIVDAKALKSEEKLYYSMAVTPLDCSGCGNCAQICPAPGKALVMKPQASQEDQNEAWDYLVNDVTAKKNPMNKNTVKGS